MIKTYLDLCDDIDILNDTLDRLKRTRKHIIDSQAPRELSGINYDGMPKGSMDATPLEVIASELMRLDAKIKAITGMIEDYTEVKNRFEKRLSCINGLEYQIAYKRDALSMSIQEIADEMGYSYAWIAEKSAKIPRIKLIDGGLIG